MFFSNLGQSYSLSIFWWMIYYERICGVFVWIICRFVWVGNQWRGGGRMSKKELGKKWARLEALKDWCWVKRSEEIKLHAAAHELHAAAWSNHAAGLKLQDGGAPARIPPRTCELRFLTSPACRARPRCCEPCSSQLRRRHLKTQAHSFWTDLRPIHHFLKP